MRLIRKPLSIGAVVWIGILTAVSVAAQPATQSCALMVRQALATAGSACEGTSRNQVCYGNLLGSVTPRDELVSVAWDTVGDRTDLTSIQSLTLSPLDEFGQWGVAMMQVQANLPDTMPGQNVTILLFGDVTLEDAVTDQIRVNGMTLRAANVRPTPGTEGFVIGSIAVNTPVVITGQINNAVGETWLQVKYENPLIQTGWVLASLVAVDMAIVPQVASDSLVHNPMQAFYFKAGLGTTQCVEVPTNGVMVQTPKGVGLVDLTVNGVSVSLGSTAFLAQRIGADGLPLLEVTLFEGQGVITSEGETRILVPGSQTQIALDEQGMAVGFPSQPQPYEPAEFEFYDEQLATLAVQLPVAALVSEIETKNHRSIKDNGGGKGKNKNKHKDKDKDKDKHDKDKDKHDKDKDKDKDKHKDKH